MKRKHRNRMGTCERLEDRRLMAGDVRVALEWGEAVVRGDNAHNSVEIREIAANTFRVTGLQDANGLQTRVNGKLFQDIYTWQDDLRVHLNGGNDYLLLKDLAAEDLTVTGGAGGDLVVLQNVRVYDPIDRANIIVDGDLDAGADMVFVNGSRLDAGLYVATGGGNDFVSIQGSTVGGQMTALLGSGNDTLQMGSGSVLHNVYADLGSGDDWLGHGSGSIDYLYALGGSGTDTFGRHPQSRINAWSRAGFEIYKTL